MQSNAMPIYHQQRIVGINQSIRFHGVEYPVCFDVGSMVLVELSGDRLLIRYSHEWPQSISALPHRFRNRHRSGHMNGTDAHWDKPTTPYKRHPNQIDRIRRNAYLSTVQAHIYAGKKDSVTAGTGL